MRVIQMVQMSLLTSFLLLTPNWIVFLKLNERHVCAILRKLIHLIDK
jgi:hypothetical protein